MKNSKLILKKVIVAIILLCSILYITNCIKFRYFSSGPKLNTFHYKYNVIKLKDDRLFLFGEYRKDRSIPNEIYDPKTNKFTFNFIRDFYYGPYGFLLKDGNILFTGAYSLQDKKQDEQVIFVYNPNTNKVIQSAKRHESRYGECIIQLDNNQVLFSHGSSRKGYVKYSEIYNLKTNNFQKINKPLINRFGATCTQLKNNEVLIIGGYENKTVEIFNPISKKYKLAEKLKTNRNFFNLIQNDQGETFILGKYPEGNKSILEVEKYNENNGTFSVINQISEKGLHNYYLVPLKNNKLLLIGTFSASGMSLPIGKLSKQIVLYDYKKNKFQILGELPKYLTPVDAIQLQNGDILIFGNYPKLLDAKLTRNTTIFHFKNLNLD